MKLLALDTAMAACSVAVHDSGRVVANAFVAMERGHAEALAPMVRDVMAKAQLEFASLARIAVTVGPGTFTGVRIGLAMARGFGVALDIPVIGIDSLSAIAANAPATGVPLLVAAGARRDEVYAALFDGAGKMLHSPAVLSMDACVRLLPEGPMAAAGTAADAVIAASSRSNVTRSRAGDLPDAANFGRFGFNLPVTGVAPVPLYLRMPDAKPQKAFAISFLEATTAQAGVFAALHAECFDTPWCAEEFATLIAMPGAAAALSLSGGEPVGFILTRVAAGEAEIVTIGTRPLARRRGIARALINHQFTEFKPRGVKACFIEVAASNTDARALYASCGFLETAVRRGYYQRPNRSREDAIVMRKELAP